MRLPAMLDSEAQQDNFSAAVLNFDNCRLVGYQFRSSDPSAFQQDRIRISCHNTSGETNAGTSWVLIFFFRFLDQLERLRYGKVPRDTLGAAVTDLMLLIYPDAQYGTRAVKLFRRFDAKDVGRTS